MTQTYQQIVLAARPQGKPQPADFRLEQATLAELQNDQVLLAVQYLSLDPYMRGRMDDRKSYAPPTPIGGVMEGESIARVMASRSSKFNEGDLVLCYSGWRTHAIIDAQYLRPLDPRIDPITTALGVMGMPGFTAYVGLRNIGKPQPEETVVVAAASGPVGSMVGQIAKIHGARAVGIAGGPQKCAFVKDQLGFDAVVDHRAPDFAHRLAAACPSGIDVYFENVGGAVWKAVMPLLNTFARVPVCGLVAHYNNAEVAQHASGPDLMPVLMREILTRSLTLRGFIQREFIDQRPQFLDEASAWMRDGRIRFREHIVQGLEHAPDAFIGMLDGQNFGKLLVKVAND